jgi:hypothetical protein
MHEHENQWAGQGPVLLDIGGDVGALIVTTPPGLRGTEIEIRPVPDGGAHPVHVGVVARPVDDALVDCAVFPELRQGGYLLNRRPGAATARLHVTIRGGQITRARWPD